MKTHKPSSSRMTACFIMACAVVYVRPGPTRTFADGYECTRNPVPPTLPGVRCLPHKGALLVIRRLAMQVTMQRGGHQDSAAREPRARSHGRRSRTDGLRHRTPHANVSAVAGH